MTVAGAGNASVSGALAGTDSSNTLTKTGTGALTLTNAGNTIGGDARIEGGTLAISGGGKLTNTIADIGFGAGSVGTVNVSGVGSEWTNTGTVFVGELADGTLSITGGGTVSAGAVNVKASSLISGASNGVLSTGTLTGTGTIRLDNAGANNALTIAQSGNSTFGGAITDAPGKVGTFTKSGAGVLTLGQLPTNTGGFIVSGGGLVLPANPVFSLAPGGVIAAQAGTTISYTGFTVRGGTLSGAGTHNVGAGASFTGTSVAGGTTITQTGATPWNGSNLRGAWNANANLSASNLTVNRAGTLAVRGGTTTVSAGGVLKGAGTFGNYVLTEFGVFSPGTASTGSAVWNGGGRFVFEIANANGIAGTDWDLNGVAGSLSLVAGASPFTIRVDSLMSDNSAGALVGFNANASYSLDVVRTTGGVSGVPAGFFALDTAGFVALNPGASAGAWSVGVSGNTVQVRYAGAAVVPEAGAGWLLLIAAPGLGLVARRRGAKA